jgi:hypothetical protein
MHIPFITIIYISGLEKRIMEEISKLHELYRSDDLDLLDELDELSESDELYELDKSENFEKEYQMFIERKLRAINNES